MFQNIADNISAAFDLLLGTLAEGQAAVRQAGANAFLDGQAGQISNYAVMLEKIPLCVEQLEVDKAAVLEVFRQQSEAQLAGAETRIDQGRCAEIMPVSDVPTLIMTYDGVCAWATENGAGVAVLAGATVKRATHGSLSKSQREFRSARERDGTLISTDNPSFLKLTRDVRFTSKSAAAVFVAGCSVSGPREWKPNTAGLFKGHQPTANPGLMN